MQHDLTNSIDFTPVLFVPKSLNYAIKDSLYELKLLESEHLLKSGPDEIENIIAILQIHFDVRRNAVQYKRKATKMTDRRNGGAVINVKQVQLPRKYRTDVCKIALNRNRAFQ